MAPVRRSAPGPGPGQCAGHGGAHGIEDDAEDVGQDLLFALEVVVEGGLGHPRGGRDVIDLRAVEAAFGEQIRRPHHFGCRRRWYAPHATPLLLGAAVAL